MRISIDEARLGDILVFKGKGQPYRIFAFFLRMFHPKWDGWGWHMAQLTRKLAGNKWQYIEATAKGLTVSCGFLTDESQIRVYRWFDDEPDHDAITDWVIGHIRRRYDIAFYFNVTAAYLFRHFWNRPIPYFLDNRYACWEAVYQMCADLGKPIPCHYDCPTLLDFLKTQGEA